MAERQGTPWSYHLPLLLMLLLLAGLRGCKEGLVKEEGGRAVSTTESS